MGRGGNTLLEAGRERVGASKLKSQCNIEAKAQMEQPPSKFCGRDVGECNMLFLSPGII